MRPTGPRRTHYESAAVPFVPDTFYPLKAAGLFRTEGKESVIRDGDEIVVRFSV